MKIIATTSFSGPEGAYAVGEETEVSDEYGAALVRGGLADEVTEKPAKRAASKKKAAKPKTETADLVPEDVEVSTQEG